MNYQFDRHFTHDEANAIIPHVRKLFDAVHALLKPEPEADDISYFVDVSGSLNGKGKNGNGNGNGNGSSHRVNFSGWSKEKRREAAYRLLNALQQQGIVIQDVERGLIDFPAIIKGKEVFLCYELNDGDVIAYFHELEAGYAGRQKLPGAFR